MIVTSYPFIDASTEGYEEEEVFYEEEEENFDHCTNQGKLYSCKLPKCKALLEQGTITYYFMFIDPNPSFYFTSFDFGLSNFSFDSWFTWSRYGVVQEHHI